MKARGTRGGILLSIEASDSLDTLADTLDPHLDLLEGSVVLELTDKTPWPLVEAIVARVRERGGEVADLRPPTKVMQARGETVIVSRTVRSGSRIESTGSVVILGDVNPGAEIIASDDIIVIGTLRGLAHAGASGNENAVIWARKILSPQLRIGSALAQAGEAGEAAVEGPEVAHLRDGQIVLRPWG